MTTRWRVLHVTLATATGILIAMMLVSASDPRADGFEMPGLIVLCTTPLLCAAIALLIAAVRAERGPRRQVVSGGLAFLALHIAMIGVAVGATFLNVPFAARFELSRAALQRAANETLAAHRGNNDPKRIGLYWVERIEVDKDDRVRFYLGDCSWYAECNLAFQPRGECLLKSSRDGLAIDPRWCLERIEYF